MGTRGSQSEFAVHMGVAPAYVSKLKKQGRLVVVKSDDGRDLVDFDLSERLIRNTADLGRAHNGNNAKPEPSPDQPAPAESPRTSGSRVDALFRQSQVQERVYIAKMAELQYRKAASEVLDKEPAIRAVYTAYRQLRDTGMVLGRKVAPVVANMADPREVRLFIERAQAEIFDSFVRRTMQSLVEALGGNGTDIPADVKTPASNVVPTDPPAA